jgi:ribosomal protein L11 methyltransferase
LTINQIGEDEAYAIGALLNAPYIDENGSYIFAFNERSEAIGEVARSLAPNAVLSWRDQDDDAWKKAYEQTFEPIEIGEFRVRPSWREAREGFIDLIVDPETAFGTGRHETTASCLEALSRFDLSGKSVLDAGCGSGILAIAAAKKGASVSLCDADAQAVKVAEKNCALNGVKPAKIWVGSADKVTTNYDLITANIVADILTAIKGDLLRALKSGGILIVSGILERFERRFAACYGDLETLFVIKRGEWRTIAYHNTEKAR